MRALLFYKSIPRYGLLKLLGRRFVRFYTGTADSVLGSAASNVFPLRLCEYPEPRLPSQRWVRVRPRWAGICGSDVATVCAKGSAYLAPVTSTPFILGHEVVGTVVEAGGDVSRVCVGDRVVLQPALGCVAREIASPCEACQSGHEALCRNVARGVVSAGIQTGYCRDTGGAFGDNFVAHESQVYRVPEDVDDRAAVLIEPFACALHGVLRAPLSAGSTALVIGCGTVGLLTIAALRALGRKVRIAAVAKYEHQRQYARDLGVDELLEVRGSTMDTYRAWANCLDAEVLRPELGKPAVLGGADATFDCVASSRSIDDGVRFTRAGGTFVLVGMPGIPSGVDWTPVWYKELSIHAAYAYGREGDDQGSRTTFDVAIELMRTWGIRLAPLVGAPFELSEYRGAFAAAMDTGRSGIVKTVFVFDHERPHAG